MYIWISWRSLSVSKSFGFLFSKKIIYSLVQIIFEDSISHLLFYTQLAEESNALTVSPIDVSRCEIESSYMPLFSLLVPRVSVSRGTLQFTPTYVMTNELQIIFVNIVLPEEEVQIIVTLIFRNRNLFLYRQKVHRTVLIEVI